ncbi:MAG: hypothetical protein LBK66_04330, partial [Spirochaetaceae bacterium]|nr:hypothetical protein [Spirochaetaceae bacterium]
MVELTYNTYESRTYNQKSKQLTKRAIVYLPYGYSEENKSLGNPPVLPGVFDFNVFYLMHGGWGNETTTIGTPARPSLFKNVIDNAIADG